MWIVHGVVNIISNIKYVKSVYRKEVKVFAIAFNCNLCDIVYSCKLVIIIRLYIGYLPSSISVVLSWYRLTCYSQILYFSVSHEIKIYKLQMQYYTYYALNDKYANNISALNCITHCSISTYQCLVRILIKQVQTRWT